MKTNFLLTVLALLIGLQITIAQSIIERGQIDGFYNPKDPTIEIDRIPLSANTFYKWEIVPHSGTQSNFTAIQFTDDYHGWIICDDGVMIYTTDAGLSWEEHYFGPSVHLNAVHFINNDTGFVAGSIDVGPQIKGIAYKTTDGGSTWENRHMLSLTYST